MSAYQYQCLTTQGAYTKGVIEADSERHARQLLREQSLIPTEIRLIARQSQHKKYTISTADLTLLTRQLATLLAAGIPLEEALRGVSEQTEKNKVRTLLMALRAKVLEGYSLAQSLEVFPTAFPELYRTTISAGEQSSRLDFVLEKLADYTEQQQASKQRVQQALIYPSIMLIVSLTMISFLLSFVVPKIIDVFTNSGQTLPPLTLCLINISHFMRTKGLYLLAFLLIIIALFKRSLKNKVMKAKWHQLLLHLPLLSYLIRNINMARYLHTFGILFAAGVPILETMRVAAHVSTNYVIRKTLQQASGQVKEGSDIYRALKESRFLKPISLHLIASGEKSGLLAEMMIRAANQMDNEIKRMMETGLTLLEPMVILVMGAMVLFIVLATLLPIFSMSQLVV